MMLGLSSDQGILTALVRYGIGAILVAMFLRMILMWFRVDERYAFVRFLAKFTDPFITPIRRLVPPVGILDISWLFAFVLLIVLQALLIQALPSGW